MPINRFFNNNKISSPSAGHSLPPGLPDSIHSQPPHPSQRAHGGLGLQHAPPLGRHRELPHRPRGVQTEGVLQEHGRVAHGQGGFTLQITQRNIMSIAAEQMVHRSGLKGPEAVPAAAAAAAAGQVICSFACHRSAAVTQLFACSSRCVHFSVFLYFVSVVFKPKIPTWWLIIEKVLSYCLLNVSRVLKLKFRIDGSRCSYVLFLLYPI